MKHGTLAAWETWVLLRISVVCSPSCCGQWGLSTIQACRGTSIRSSLSCSQTYRNQTFFPRHMTSSKCRHCCLHKGTARTWGDKMANDNCHCHLLNAAIQSFSHLDKRKQGLSLSLQLHLLLDYCQSLQHPVAIAKWPLWQARLGHAS